MNFFYFLFLGWLESSNQSCICIIILLSEVLFEMILLYKSLTFSVVVGGGTVRWKDWLVRREMQKQTLRRLQLKKPALPCL